VVVAEKRRGETEVGAGLQLSPNASHILLQWGLGSTLAQTAVAPTELCIRRWGEPRAYARMPFDRPADNAPFWVMLRSDLHATLKSAVLRNPAIDYREGCTLERFRDDGRTLRINLQKDGKITEIEAISLIGADGQQSQVRRLLGDARDLDRPGWEAWRTLIPAEQTPDFIRAAATNLWLGRDSHAVHYPVAGGKLINLVVIRRSGETDSSWSRVGDPGQLADLAALAAPTLRDLMAQAPSWAVWTLRDRAPSPFFAKGAAALIGDAAHPVLPFLAQGAAMAIEDAAVLADCLPAPADWDRSVLRNALARYADIRGSRVTRVYKAARANAFNYHLPRPLAWLRDRRMAQLGPDGMRQRFSWLYDWRMEPNGR
jgi:salicylate hydroxylase